MTFEKAREADLEAVASIYSSVIGQKGCTWSKDYPTRGDALNDARAGGLYVLRQDGRVVGALSIVAENELDDIDLWRVKDDALYREIARVCVAKEMQGRGYSMVMLDRLLEMLLEQGCKAVHLLVAKDNLAAISTYRDMGFEFLGECYRYEHDFYICEKEL